VGKGRRKPKSEKRNNSLASKEKKTWKRIRGGWKLRFVGGGMPSGVGGIFEGNLGKGRSPE